MGILAAGGAAVRKRTVDAYLRNVAQIFASAGDINPCLDHLFRVYFCLGWQIHEYFRADTPPTHIYSILVALPWEFRHCLRDGDACHRVISDLLFITFLFLCRPG